VTAPAGQRARSPGTGTRSRRADPVAAAELPIARVAVDVPLPHLDRLFDYQVPEALADSARPGCRVKVRFSGRLTDGYLVERAATSEHAGKIAFLQRVVSAEPVLTTPIAELARKVADRYGGTVADVLRLAIPPRHATVERASAQVQPHDQPKAQAGAAAASPSAAAQDATPGHALWARYQAGPAFLAALAGGRAPRAVWSALPGPDWAAEIAAAAAIAHRAARGALVIVPDARDLEALDAAMAAAVGPGSYVSLAAQLGPAERYRRWLAVLRQQVRVVIGTRSAMFAPVAALGLVAIWDDGDDLHAEPRAPYPHARDVLLLRAHQCGAAALIGGFARTAEATQLIATGWAKPLAAARPTVRLHAPLIRVAGDDSELARDEAAKTARIPGLALRTAREALADGPVLFQVPRRGYLASVACRNCGERIRCAACAGPVALAGPGQPAGCRWCGLPVEVTCAHCGNAGLRALVIGARRTAEELGRAFPGVAVRTSSGADTLRAVPAEPAIVIATPGAEPTAPGSYSAAVLLDGWAMLSRPSLRAAEEALRRWMNAAALVRSSQDGGKVVMMADPAVPVVQALLRWDAAGYAERELAERTELRFPPAVRMAALTGPPQAVASLLESVALPDGAEVLGPVPLGSQGPAPAGREPVADTARFLVRAPASAGTRLAVALRSGLAERSARKEQGSVRLQLDPAELI
jgi:primosomal protein N' (replication factor Y) (superfamily II helicase)